MSSDAHTNDLLLPDDVDATRLIELFGGPQCCRQGGSTDFSLCYYDSFDWRLDSADLRLLQVALPESGLLRLQSVGGEPLVEPVLSVAEPAWPVDLPGGELQARVARLLDVRVLLPVVRVRVSVIELDLLNEDAKIVVRLQLLSLLCDESDRPEPPALRPRLRLIPVRGYPADFQRARELLSGDMQWSKAPPCIFEEALTAVGRAPGDYSSKLAVSLDPDQTALEALREILLALLETIERNIPGTRADLDTEFLHDLRVAVRRTRSALTQVKRVLPESVVAKYKERFASLGQITGPTRDLDVFLLELPDYRAELPPAMAADLDALETHLRKAQRAEQRRLKRRLGSPSTKALLQSWRALLEAPILPDELGDLSSLPVEQLASQRIWRMYKKVLKAGRLIRPDGPPEALHDLRKDCKKLRYLIEFFRDLYPARPIKQTLRVLKDLLDVLGQFQDREQQADWLREVSVGFDQRDPQGLRSLMSIGALVANLLRDQQHARERFADSFGRFESADNRKLYRTLCKGRGA